MLVGLMKNADQQNDKVKLHEVFYKILVSLQRQEHRVEYKAKERIMKSSNT